MKGPELLEAYINEIVSELHIDQKMKAVIAGRAGHKIMQQAARAKGLLIRWGLERGIELTPKLHHVAAAAFKGYTKRYGHELAPHALIQFLDRKYNIDHVGNKSDVPTRGSGSESKRAERTDDQEDVGLVRSSRAL